MTSFYPSYSILPVLFGSISCQQGSSSQWICQKRACRESLGPPECYFDDLGRQRSCYDICHGTTSYVFADCLALCPDFLRSYCINYKSTTTQVTNSISISGKESTVLSGTSWNEKTTRLSPIKSTDDVTSPNNYLSSTELTVAVVLPVVVLVAVIVFLLIKYTKRGKELLRRFMARLKGRSAGEPNGENRPRNSERDALQRSSNAGTLEEQADNAGTAESGRSSAAPTQTRRTSFVAVQESGNDVEDNESLLQEDQ